MQIKIWPFKLKVEKGYKMGSINIEDALKEMNSGGDVDFTAGPEPFKGDGLPPIGQAPSAIINSPPKRRAALSDEDEPTFAPSVNQQTTVVNNTNERFIVIRLNDEGEVSITFHAEEVMSTLVEEIGAEKVIRFIPNENPKLWGDKVIILRGSIVIPKPVVSFKFESF